MLYSFNHVHALGTRLWTYPFVLPAFNAKVQSCRSPRRRRCAAAESPRRPRWANSRRSRRRRPPRSAAFRRGLREDDGTTTAVATGHSSPRPRTGLVHLVEERRVLAQVVPDDPELAARRCPPDVVSASVPHEASHGVSRAVVQTDCPMQQNISNIEIIDVAITPRFTKASYPSITYAFCTNFTSPSHACEAE